MCDPKSSGTKGVLHKPQIFRTETSPADVVAYL